MTTNWNLATLSNLLSGKLNGSLGDLLGDSLRVILNHDLDVSRGGHVSIDSTVGSVGTTSHLWSLVTVDVGDNELLDIKTLDLSVGLDVAKKINEDLGGLDWPRDLVTRSLVLLGDGVTGDTTGVLGEWNGILEVKDVLKVGLGVGEGAALDGVTNLTGVLEVDTDVRTGGLSSLLNILWDLTIIR